MEDKLKKEELEANEPEEIQENDIPEDIEAEESDDFEDSEESELDELDEEEPEDIEDDSEVDSDDSDPEEEIEAEEDEPDIEAAADDEPEEDSDDEFDYLFQEESEETATKEDSNTESNRADFQMPKYLTPGTDEYFSAIKEYAEKAVEQTTGEEYDSFDDDHKVKFDFYLAEAKNLVSKKREEVKVQVKVNKAKAQADQQIEKILPNEEMKKAYINACQNLKHKHFIELKQKAAEGDFSGFVKLANKVAGVKSKVARIKKKSKNKPKVKKRTDGFGGVAELLGF